MPSSTTSTNRKVGKKRDRIIGKKRDRRVGEVVKIALCPRPPKRPRPAEQ